MHLDIGIIYAIEDIAETLKKARERKGLSQRALSELSGVRQYQISKVENGAVDLRLSSLVELARALDLDFKLIPRSIVPAVDNIVRSSVPKAPAPPVLEELGRMLDTVERLRSLYSDLGELTRLQNILHNFGNFQDPETLREIAKPIRELEKLTELSRNAAEARRLPPEPLRALQEATNAARKLVHNVPASSLVRVRPVYSLDENNDV